MHRIRRSREDPRRGAALVMVALLVVSLGILSFALMSTVSSANRALRASRNDLNSVYVSEAGISHAVYDLANGGDGNLGDAQNPVRYGGAEYWVQAKDLGSGLTSLIASGSENGAVARLELILRSSGSAGSFYQWAAFGRDSMTMDSNARTDSYDSSLGSYASQATNGNGNSQRANENGDIGSNSNISAKSNSKVWGDAVPGPGMTASFTGNSTVSGATTPAPAPVALPAIVVPPIASSGDWSVSGSQTLASGDHAFDRLTVGGTLTVQGPARIVVTDFMITSNRKLIVDATNGTVELYVLNNFELNSASLIQSQTSTPSDVSLFLQSDNLVGSDTIVFDSNAEVFGTIYAPNAHAEIDSNFRLYGSLVAGSVHLDSNSRIHFDEALLNAAANAGADGAYETVCWRLLPDQN